MFDVMHSRFSEVTGGVYVVSIWDPPPWKMTTNCYILHMHSGVTLVDCGRDVHAPFISEALNHLGLSTDDVRYIVATHRHADHTGGAVAFRYAVRYVSELDWPSMSVERQPLFEPLTGATREICGLSLINLPWHTPGSVGFYHPASGALFTGDHIGFFHTPEEGLVGRGQALRKRVVQRVAQWAGDPKEQLEDRLAEWTSGIRTLADLRATALCPGHGGVLRGEIPQFLSALVSAAGDGQTTGSF